MSRIPNSSTAKTVGIVALVIAVIMTLPSATTSLAAEKSQIIRWDKLAPLPDREGFAGSFAGVSHGALFVAGGANFPEKRPWEGGTKIWYDSVFVLEKPDGQWKSGGKLPHPLGYGVAITHESGMICIGGSDAKQHRTEVFSVAWSKGVIRTNVLPALPRPCANMCGALLSNTIYIAGGLEKPDSTNTLQTFWALDLKETGAGWKEMNPWPGPGRMLAVAGVADGAFFLFGGASLKNGPDNKPVREWLRDAYQFTPGKGWKHLADLPRAAVAAPSPAPASKHLLFVLGGDDGAQVNTPPTQHTGFPRDILAYDTVADAWSTQGEMPFGLVTTPLANWNGKIIIPGGEQRPGVRSTEVWAGTLKK
ncbi:MAG: Galactose oxidase [Verrucomicrobiales bacterium]|nr:Galactose oxidase [Verrucomicrobiales bacterium]